MTAENHRHHRVELAHADGQIVSRHQIEESADEASESIFDARNAERRRGMRTFDFLDIERNLPNPAVEVEIVKLIGVVERLSGEHRDDVERHVVTLQLSYAFRHTMLSRTAFAGLAIAIVDERRPVDADADIDVMPFEEFAPVVVDQHAVGLERMPHLQTAGIVRGCDFNCALVVRDRQHHRLARVPHDGEAVLDDAAGKHRLKNAIQGRVGHPALRVTIGKIAVGAIEIAERSRLQHEQLERPGDTPTVARSHLEHSMPRDARRTASSGNFYGFTSCPSCASCASSASPIRAIHRCANCATMRAGHWNRPADSNWRWRPEPAVEFSRRDSGEYPRDWCPQYWHRLEARGVSSSRALSCLRL